MKLFRHRFSQKNEQNMDNGQNPWAGLASYEDPEKVKAEGKEPLRFCGRDNDSYDVAKLIMGSVFVTLYGKSGIGKTSLLNAGVFPELREEQCTPFSLRLGMRDENDTKSFQTIIIEAIERIVKSTEKTEIIPVQDNKQATDFLWKYFAGHHFYDKNDDPTTPVVVFDQFEEVFRNNREEAEILLRQLDNCVVNGQSHRYETNVRFVVSIREDDLYRLEDSIDNCYLPALKRCRYRLRSLSEDDARDAILIPGEGLFKEKDQDQIVQTIIRIACQKENKSISTNLLSLVCSRLYVEFQKTGIDYITPTLVDTFIKDNPFERFYNEATRGFSNHEKSYIEDHFVDSTGRRNSIPESDFLLNVPKGSQLLDGNARILQHTSTSGDGGSYRIELIHDSFCEPLTIQKGKREKRKRLYWLSLVVSIILLSSGIVTFVLYQMNKIEKTNWKMMENQARAVAGKAEQLMEEGDIYTAISLCLEVIPTNLESPEKPYVVEAEKVLRRADWDLLFSENVPLAHFEVVSHYNYADDWDFGIVPQNQYLWTSTDHRKRILRIYDINSGALLHEKIRFGELPDKKDFSPDGLYYVTNNGYTYGKEYVQTYGDEIQIWNIKDGCLFNTLKQDNSENNIGYYPDGRWICISPYHSTKNYFYDAHSLQKVFDIDFWEAFDVINDSLLFHGDSEYMGLYNLKSNAIVYGEENISRWSYGRNAPFVHSDSLFVRIEDKKIISIYDIFTGKPARQSIALDIDKLYEFDLALSSNDDYVAVIFNHNGTFLKVFNLKSNDSKIVKISNEELDLDVCYYSFGFPQILINSENKTVISVNVETNEIKYSSLSDFYPNEDFLFVRKGRGEPTAQLIRLKNKNKIVPYKNIKETIIELDRDGLPSCVIGNNRYGIHRYEIMSDSNYVVMALDNRDVYIFNYQEMKYKHVYSFNYEDILCAAIDEIPHTNQLALVTSDSLYIIDYKTSEFVNRFRIPHSDVQNCVCSNSGNSVVISLDYSRSFLYDIHQGKILCEFDKFFDFNVTFSPSEKLIACTLCYEDDWAIALFDVQTGNLRWLSNDVRQNGQFNNYYLKFSDDEKYIVCASRDSKNSICVFEVTTGKTIATLIGHTQEIRSVDFSPDGNYIVSASKDGSVFLWSFMEEQLLQSFYPQFGEYIVAEFLNDSTIKVSCSYGDKKDYEIKYPFFTIKEIVDRNRERFKNRQLTPEERRKYYLK